MGGRCPALSAMPRMIPPMTIGFYFSSSLFAALERASVVILGQGTVQSRSWTPRCRFVSIGLAAGRRADAG